MATIEMDISEYDLMRENARLLEESVKSEKLLRKQLKQIHEEKEILVQEKFKAYEEAKMSVAYIKRLITYEHRVGNSETTDDLYLINQKFYKWFNIRPNDSSLIRGFVNYILEFYSKTTKSENVTEEIEYKGFDKVKNEIQTELENNLSKEIKEKIGKYNKLHKDFTFLNEKKETLDEILLEANQEIKDLKTLLESKDVELLTVYEQSLFNQEILYKIYARIQDRGLFNKNTILDNILIYCKQIKITE
jgi:hypothetical protein